MIDEDMLCMALFPVICGPQGSLDDLISKLTNAVQELGNTRMEFLQQRAADSYERCLSWRLPPIGMVVDENDETVHWQVVGDHMGVETPACARTADPPNSWMFRREKRVRITCPECRKLLGYARKVAARRM